MIRKKFIHRSILWVINMHDKGYINNRFIKNTILPLIENRLSKECQDTGMLKKAETTLWITSMEPLCEKGCIIPGTKIEISFKNTILTTRLRVIGSILDSTKFTLQCR